MAHQGPEEKRLSPIVAVVGFVVTAVVAFLIGYFIASPPSITSVPDSSAELAKVTVDSELLPVKGSPAKGSHKAPVTIVEFGDFQCTACRAASDALINSAMREYGEDNVRIIWKNLPLSTHPDARLAAQAAWAAGQQGKFWEFHDKVFDAFPTDRKDAKGFEADFNSFLKSDKLVGYAKDLNLDDKKFLADMNSKEAEAALERDTQLAEGLGLRSTPSIFVNGRKVSFKQGVSYPSVKQIIDEELSKSNDLLESANGYYSYAVWANRSLADGIKTGPSLAEDAVAADRGGRPEVVEAGGGNEQPQPSAALPTGQETAGGVGPDISTLPVKGAPNGKVTILAFSDFQCPFCGKVNPTVEELLKAYPNDVRVAFAMFPLDFHKDAPLAAQAALAAHEQGKFWQYHDLLFANQKAIQRADLEKYAEQLGLNMAKFRAALDSKKYETTIATHLADGRKFGITGTPSFLINGRKFVGAQPTENFKKIIDEEIKRADALSKAKGLTGENLYKALVLSAPKEAAPPQAAEAPEDDGRHLVVVGDSPVIGDKNAPVTIVEFSDFECPFCSRGAETLKELLEKNPGKVKIVFKHFPLEFHKSAPLAARAAVAANKQGKFWEYHDMLFKNQKALGRDNLVSYAQQLQLNMAKFEADLDNAELDKVIEADKAAAGKVGVRGTPHFFINGTRFSGAQPLASFQAALDREYKTAQDYLAKGVAKDKLYETIISSEKTQAPAPVEVDIKGSPIKGPASAKVTIIEFSDFQCPFCSKVLPTFKQIHESYPNDVKIVF